MPVEQTELLMVTMNYIKSKAFVLQTEAAEGRLFTRKSTKSKHVQYIPCCTRYALMFLKITINLSVPRCGLPSTRILSGAPWVTRDSRILRTSALFLPVRDRKGERGEGGRESEGGREREGEREGERE
jgi:hypothetical protein